MKQNGLNGAVHSTGTATFLREDCGEYGLADGTGDFRSFRLKWKKRKTLQDFHLNCNKLYNLIFQPKIPAFHEQRG